MDAPTEDELFLLQNCRVIDRASNPTGPVFAFNFPEGTFRIDLIKGRLVASGSLEPDEAAELFFEGVGRRIIEMARKDHATN